jgi:hypothetical protein
MTEPKRFPVFYSLMKPPRIPALVAVSGFFAETQDPAVLKLAQQVRLK